MESKSKEQSLNNDLTYPLSEAPYECPCGHKGKFKEILDNNWKCPKCNRTMWSINEQD